MIDFVKMMFNARCDIAPYVAIGTITADDYKQITGNDYAAGENA